MQKLIDTEFFKKWTHDSAYLIGYICADGCVHKRSNRNNSYILTITSKDKDHLHKINTILSSNYAISKKIGGSGSISYNLSISNTELCLDLINLGITPRKTFTISKVDVPDSLFCDFLRGYFDADGSIYIYKVNNTWQLKLALVSASKNFLELLEREISFRLQLERKNIYTFQGKGKNNPLHSLVFYINDGQKFLKFIYKNSPHIFLERKYEVFNKWKTIKRRSYILTTQS